MMELMARMVDRPPSPGRRLAWVLVTILLGPFGLLAYLLTRRKVRREVKYYENR